MMDLRKLSNAELEVSTDRAVGIEKEAITNTTRHFQEVYRRRSYLPTYSSMFEYLTKKHNYCNTSAQLRISTLNLILQVPIAQQKLEQGELSMSAAASIQTFLNMEKKSARPYSQNAKIELVEACLHKSTRELQKEFVRRNPEIETRDKVRHTSETRVRIDVSISDQTLIKLNQLRDILSHVDPTMSLGDLIERLAEDGLNKYCSKRKSDRALQRAYKAAKEVKVKIKKTETAVSARGATRAKDEENSADCPSAVLSDDVDQQDELARVSVGPFPTQEMKRSRYIPATEKHSVANDEKGCTYLDDKTHQRCGSTKFLQLDHVEPFAKGGENKARNLRWMCGVHNRWRFGAKLTH